MNVDILYEEFKAFLGHIEGSEPVSVEDVKSEIQLFMDVRLTSRELDILADTEHSGTRCQNNSRNRCSGGFQTLIGRDAPLPKISRSCV